MKIVVSASKVPKQSKEKHISPQDVQGTYYFPRRPQTCNSLTNISATLKPDLPCRTASVGSSRSHRTTRQFQDEQGDGNESESSLKKGCFDRIASTNGSTKLKLGTLYMSPVRMDKTIESRINNSEEYALKALNLLSEAANSILNSPHRRGQQ